MHCKTSRWGSAIAFAGLALFGWVSAVDAQEICTIQGVTFSAADPRGLTVRTGAGTITGTEGNDLIIGSDGADTIDGLGGDDVICGRGGDDTIRGGAGNDQIKGGPGNDQLSGQEGNDVIKAGVGDDTVAGEAGDDQVRGGMGTDRCDGGLGGDIFANCETTADDGTPPPATPGAVAAAPFDPAPFIGRGDAFDCRDFASQAQAQAVLRAAPLDPNLLDQNLNGIACEDNGGAQDRTPVRRTVGGRPRVDDP